ncbi:MAG: hypothetical protein ACFFDH_03925 [Promethearchaeota archaeon]
MKNFRSNKTILLILMLSLPTTILFGTINSNVHAKEYIPEENIDNAWHWHDDIQLDELLIYEFEVLGKNLTSDSMIAMSKELRIYNITGFSNETSQFGFGDISYINGTWNYYNCTSDKIIPESFPFGETPHNIAGFGFNSSGTFREYYEAEEYSINCIILPINGSNGLQVDILSNIINKTYLDIFAQLGYTQSFDYVSTNNVDENHNIYFKNSTNDYFINSTYYNNGTLRYYEGSYVALQGTDFIEYNFTMTRVFNYNITDEIEWDIDVGDRLYFGLNDDYGGYNEIEMLITGIDNSVFSVLGSGGPIHQCFEIVLTNLSIWNPVLEEYVLQEENFTIGAANNFYPFIFGQNIPLVIPKNTELENIDFLFNNYTHEIYGSGFPFDEINSKLEDGKIKMNLRNSIYENVEGNFVYDDATGISDFMELDMMGDRQITYRKNMTTIENQVEAESVLLYSDLIGSNEIYINYTYITNEDFELYWATLPVNPTLVEFPYEIYNMPLYVDVYGNLSNYRFMNPINVTLYYDDSLLSQDMENNLAPFYCDIDNEIWIEVPEVQVTLDTDKNTLTVVGLESIPFSEPQYFALGIREWTWGVDVDDLIIVSADAIGTNITTKKVLGAFRDFYIFTITSIEDVIKEWLGEPHQIFSQVNFTWLYYDTNTGSLEWNPNDPYGDPSIMMEFCANDSSAFPLKFGEQNPYITIPYILPLRYGHLNLTILAPVLNETFFGNQPYLPKWDQVIPNDIANTIYFYNSTDGYYIDLAYYENGTIKSVDAYYTSIDMNLYNGSLKRFFNYNLTSNVEWSVKAGDDLYFGDMDKEIKFHIVEINETTVNMNDIAALPYISYQTFSNVWADIYYWNATDEYWMYQYRSIIGAANNLFPLGPGMYHAGQGIEPVWPFFLIPTGISGDEMFDYMKMLTWLMKVDTLSGIGDNYISFTNSTGPNYIHFEWDNSTGVVKLLYGFMTNPLEGKDEYVAIFAKNRVILPLGLSSVVLDNYFVPDITLSINITTNSVGCELYYAILDINPTNESLPVGTPMFYGDMMINNHTLVEGNFTMEVHLPLTIDLNEIYLYLNGWFPSMGGWQTMPAEDMDNILVYIYSINTVLATMSSEDPFYSIGAWSYTPKAPGAFLLNSTAEDPDDDGDFTLSWGAADRATNYSIYEYDSFINDTNIGSATLLGTYTTTFVHSIEDYTDGIYFFIVKASNAYGYTLSNCIQVNVTLPTPPGPFTLTSNAGSPDNDGNFTLTWGAAVGAVSYSVYRYSGYITEINGSLTTLATGITSLSLPLTGYTNGTYYFIVVAHNDQGNTLSNCHAVTVEIPPEEPEGGHGGGIPGYSLYLLLTVFILITAVILLKKSKKII